MRAVQVIEPTGPADVRVVDVPDPEPGPGEVLVEVHAVGVSFPDLLLSKGMYQLRPDPPFTLGVDVAGTVVSGPGVRARGPGRRRGGVRRCGRARRRPRTGGLPAPRAALVRRGRGAADELPDRALRPRSSGGRCSRARRCSCTAPPAESVRRPSRSRGRSAPAPSAWSPPRRRRQFAREAGADEVGAPRRFTRRGARPDRRPRRRRGASTSSAATSSPTRCAASPSRAGCWWSASRRARASPR